MILQGNESVDKWRKEQKLKHMIHNEVRIELVEKQIEFDKLNQDLSRLENDRFI